MLHSKRMHKVSIVGPQHVLESTIETLHNLAIIHFVSHKKTADLDIGTPLATAEESAQLLVETRALISQLTLHPSDEQDVLHTHEEFDLKTLKKQLCELKEEVSRLGEEKLAVMQRLQEKETLKTLVHDLSGLPYSLDAYYPYKNLTLFVGFVKEQATLDSELTKITTQYELSFSKTNHNLLALFVPKETSTAIRTVLSAHQYAELDLRSIFSQNEKRMPTELLSALNAEIATLYDKKRALEQELNDLCSEHSSFLFDSLAFLTSECDKKSAPLHFAQSKRAFMITGWVPEGELGQTTKALLRATNGSISVKEEEIVHKDKVPTLFQNSRLVKPSEFFLHLFNLPSYHEIDPSLFLFLTFPLFFALMLGDVGYGFATLILFGVLRMKLPKARDLLTIMMYCSLITMVFGFMFGEYFGYEHVSADNFLVSTLHLPLHQEVIHGEVVYVFPHLLNRMHAEMAILGYSLPTVLVLGGILGFLHVNLSIFLGFINELHSHGFIHAALAKLSWYIFELGLVLIILPQVGVLALPIWIGALLTALGVLGIGLGEGVNGLIELPALFSNILSYLRIGAVGLASVGLAIVINENLAEPFLERGGIFVAVAILILIFGHAINIGLGILGPFLHSIRLHYVEFFSRFFKGGGIEFKAFGNSNNKNN